MEVCLGGQEREPAAELTGNPEACIAVQGPWPLKISFPSLFPHGLSGEDGVNRSHAVLQCKQARHTTRSLVNPWCQRPRKRSKHLTSSVISYSSYWIIWALCTPTMCFYQAHPQPLPSQFFLYSPPLFSPSIMRFVCIFIVYLFLLQQLLIDIRWALCPRPGDAVAGEGKVEREVCLSAMTAEWGTQEKWGRPKLLGEQVRPRAKGYLHCNLDPMP